MSEPIKCYCCCDALGKTRVNDLDLCDECARDCGWDEDDEEESYPPDDLHGAIPLWD